MTMNKYGINIEFEIKFTAQSYEKALEMLNSKHYIKDAEVCNFVNIPVDNVHVYPSEDTELKMMNKELK
jgi:hypothetical protein